jgi:hypothetical protein
MNFKEFLNLHEFGEIINAPPENVNLTPSGSGGLRYVFKLNDQPYEVLFTPIKIKSGYYGIITQNAFEIAFYGPDDSISPTGVGKGTEAYKYLIQAVKKLIELKNPEGLKFSGAVVEQRLMYASFYSRYLSKLYTQIDRQQYLRNDFLKAIEQENGEVWGLVKQQRLEFSPTAYLDEIKSGKEARRKAFLMLKGEAVGKIIYSPSVGIAYFKSIEPHQATLLSAGGPRLHADTVTSYQNNIRPIKPGEFTDPRYQKEIERLKAALEAKGIKDVQLWQTIKAFQP